MTRKTTQPPPKKPKNPQMDSLTRCKWVQSTTDPLYVKYHDEEWGVPVRDDRKHYEFLVLESSQAGLSWLTILRKRENYRAAFAEFDPKRVMMFGEKEVETLLQNPGIIRNRLKVLATIHNASCFLNVQKEFGSFDRYCWEFVGGKPKVNAWKTHRSVPPTTEMSDRWSKDLKQRGFKFLGSTVLYAHMQAVGMVNDHTLDCFRYKECARLAKGLG